jgi:hypothetical protein
MKSALTFKRTLDFAFGTVASVIVTVLLGTILYSLS